MRGINFEIKGNKLLLKKKLSKDETYKLNNREKTCSLIIYKKLKEVIGFTSMCEDGKHIILLDYDNICRWIVIEDLYNIVNKFKLSPFYIFQTKEAKIDGELVGNYHCICLTKKLPSEVVEIQKETHCDRSYTTMPLRNIFRSWVIRTSKKGRRGKPEYVCSIGTKNLNNLVSEAHLNLLRRLYNIQKDYYTNLDGGKKIYKNIYKTGNF